MTRCPASLVCLLTLDLVVLWLGAETGLFLIHHWCLHPTEADEPGPHWSLHPTQTDNPDQEALSSQPRRVSNGVVSQKRTGVRRVDQQRKCRFYKTLNFWSWCSGNTLLFNSSSVQLVHRLSSWNLTFSFRKGKVCWRLNFNHRNPGFLMIHFQSSTGGSMPL